MKNWPFCDVLTTAEHFAQVLVQKHTIDDQLGGQCEHVYKMSRYHAYVQSKVYDCCGLTGFCQNLIRQIFAPRF